MEFKVWKDGPIFVGWKWTLHTADGPLCESAGFFDSEKECRSAIAKAKKTMKGAGYAKVVTQDA